MCACGEVPYPPLLHPTPLHSTPLLTYTHHHTRHTKGALTPHTHGHIPIYLSHSFDTTRHGECVCLSCARICGGWLMMMTLPLMMEEMHGTGRVGHFTHFFTATHQHSYFNVIHSLITYTPLVLGVWHMYVWSERLIGKWGRCFDSYFIHLSMTTLSYQSHVLIC